jgi:hypothetical protein
MKRSVLAALLVTAACATTNKNGPRVGGGSETDDGMVCTEVNDTGTLFSHTECKPREQREAETDDARRALQPGANSGTHQNLPPGDSGSTRTPGYATTPAAR